MSLSYRIRPCLLPNDEDGFPQGWRLSPLMADSTALAGALLDVLLGDRHDSCQICKALKFSTPKRLIS
ncbi:hypothetical protein NON20_00115 [Synechocystis sp. B12]|nr:hypothetical protein NON20_00115 [Synechocystis sp. B12]